MVQAVCQQLAQLHQHVGMIPAQIPEYDPVQPEQDAIAGGDGTGRGHAIVGQNQLAEIGWRDQMLGRAAGGEQALRIVSRSKYCRRSSTRLTARSVSRGR